MTQITYASLALNEDDHRAFEAAGEALELGKSYPIYLPQPVYRRNKHLVIRNPANLPEILWIFPQGAAQDVDLAIGIAKDACETVYQLGWQKRIDIIRRAGEIILAKVYEFATIVSREASKPRGEALAEVKEVAAMCTTYPAYAERYDHYRMTLSAGTEPPYEQSETRIMPLGGVVGIIPPNNFPLALAANPSIPAIIAGNPVAFKPAPETPLSTSLWRNTLVEAGFPEEACPLIVGKDTVVGEAFLHHPDIACIAFTGSLTTGQHILMVHANLFRNGILRASPVMEMGGKNGTIVTPSADIEAAAKGIFRAAFNATGRKCSATSRAIVVGNKTKSRLVETLMRLAHSGLPTSSGENVEIIIGRPELRETYMGPTINAESFHNHAQIMDALASDAISIERFGRLSDGCRPWSYGATPQAGEGYYVMPLIVGIHRGSRLSRKELFLPILFIEEAPSLPIAIRMANATPYGLCAGIFTQDEEERRYFFDHIEAGVAYSDREGGSTTGAWPGVQTFGGYKGSGTSRVNGFGPWYITLFGHEQCRTTVRKPN